MALFNTIDQRCITLARLSRRLIYLCYLVQPEHALVAPKKLQVINTIKTGVMKRRVFSRGCGLVQVLSDVPVASEQTRWLPIRAVIIRCRANLAPSTGLVN